MTYIINSQFLSSSIFISPSSIYSIYSYTFERGKIIFNEFVFSSHHHKKKSQYQKDIPKNKTQRASASSFFPTKKKRNSTKQCTHAIEAHPPQVFSVEIPLSPQTGMVYTGVRRMGKSGVLSAAKKTRIHFVSRGGKGMRKTVRDAEGRKNRVNTESSDPIPSWTGLARVRKGEGKGEGGIGKEGSGEAPLLRRWRGIAIFCALVGGDRIAL